MKYLPGTYLFTHLLTPRGLDLVDLRAIYWRMMSCYLTTSRTVITMSPGIRIFTLSNDVSIQAFRYQMIFETPVCQLSFYLPLNFESLSPMDALSKVLWHLSTQQCYEEVLKLKYNPETVFFNQRKKIFPSCF